MVTRGLTDSLHTRNCRRELGSDNWNRDFHFFERPDARQVPPDFL
jgi:hypothetical protein